jgi:hypothetical protein
MKINLDRPVYAINGQPFDPATSLREAIYAALASSIPGDEKLELKDKLDIHRLLAVVYLKDVDQSGSSTLNAEQIIMIKKRVNMFYISPHFVGQVVEMLEGGNEKGVG